MLHLKRVVDVGRDARFEEHTIGLSRSCASILQRATVLVVLATRRAHIQDFVGLLEQFCHSSCFHEIDRESTSVIHFLSHSAVRLESKAKFFF